MQIAFKKNTDWKQDEVAKEVTMKSQDDHVLEAHTSKGKKKKGNFKRFKDKSFESALDFKKKKRVLFIS